MVFELLLAIAVLTVSSGFSQQTTKHDVNDDVSSITNRVTFLEQMVQKTTSELNSMKNELVLMKTDLQSTKTELAAVKTSTNTAIAQLRTNVKYEVQLENPMPSFSKIGATLKFDTIKVNDGNGYNSTTGRFTAPVSGTFLLWANVVLLTTNANLDLVLKVNGAAVARGMSHPGNIGFDTAVITYITDLQHGDETWYEKYYGDGDYLRGALYSTYGGVLLTPK